MSDQDESLHPGEEMAQMSTPKLIGMMCLQAGFFVALGLAMWWLAGKPLEKFVNVSLGQIALGFGIAIALGGFGLALTRMFPDFAEQLVRDQKQQFAFLERGLGIGPIIIFAACAGIGEEAVFRGGLMVLLDQYTPFAVALILSAAVFTVIHFAKPVVAAFIFIIGLFFGLVYWASGSLLAVMIGHWVYDIWALWFIQKEMKRLGVFDDTDDPAKPLHEDGVVHDA